MNADNIIAIADDMGVATAQLQPALLQVSACNGGDAAAHRIAAGEGDGRDLRVGDQFADVLCLHIEICKDAGGNMHTVEEVVAGDTVARFTGIRFIQTMGMFSLVEG
jgi:hypothetical protein